MKLLYAIRFLTIIPIPYRQDEDMASVARATIFFPAVGLIIGGLLYGASLLSVKFFIPEVSSALILLIWVVITGGLHLDGLADLADGLGGGKTRTEKLSIMKDSRTGAFGAIALIIQLLLKWTLILQFIKDGASFSLLLIPMGARWITMNFILIFPSARKDGMGSFFKEYSRVREPLLAGFFTLAAAFLIGGLPGIFACLAALLLLSIATLVISRILEGLTGDVYGSLIETGEVLIMLLLPLFIQVFIS
ncbi:MAG: adenosylcobinamide-GDP ribazoletransferase [Spirochaetales bacterium]|nr:adenosylcobinamide-GDP ribazoletransferase [Spirochaetales bacterium]